MLAVEMTKTAIEADRVRFALDRVTNGDGQKWWSLSADYAKRFGLNVNSVADNLMNMQASGFSEDMTKTLFLRMGDLRALGATEETIGRALLAIRQVQAAGRLQGDELNQLSEAGINANFVYAELSKTLGKTIPEIIKMKEAGELTSAIVIPAIANAIGAKTGGGAAGAAGEAAATQTVSGQWGRMTGAFSVASTNALGSDAMAPLRLAISNFTDWISGPGGSAAIGGFGKMLTGLFEQAPVVIEKVIWLFDEGLPAAWKGFSAGFEEAGGSAVFGALSNGLSNLAGDNGEQARSSLASLGQTMGSLAGSLATLVGWLVQATSALTSLVDVGSVFSSTVAPITGIFKGFNGAGDASIGDALRQTPIFQGLSGAFSGIGLDMANGLASGLSAGNPAVQAAASQLATAAEMAARDTSETHSPSKAFERVGMDQGDGNAQGLIKSIPQIQSASTAMTNGSLSSAKDASTAGGSGGPVTVQISIDRGQGDGRSDGDLLELAADIFERRMTQLFGRLAYSGAR
jgi:tape measure domain-containing protein